MKVIISKNVLVEALATVKRVVVGRSTLPILSNVRVAVSPGRLELTCTNLDQELRVILCLGVKTSAETDGGAFCVKAGLFHDIVKALPEIDAACEVELSSREGEPLEIRSHESFYTLGILPAADFPPSSELEKSQSLALMQGRLLHLIASTSSAMSEDDSRYVLCGALLELAKDFRCVATDGRRLALADQAESQLEVEKPANIILPSAAVAQLLALLSTNEEKSVEMEFTANAARFTFDASAAVTVVFTTKLLEGSYPNYQQVLDMAKDGVKCAVGRPELQSAVERVSLVNKVISLTFKGTRLTVSATNDPKDAPASAEELVPCEKVKALRIKLQSEYLLDALASVEVPQIVFQLQDELSALVVSSPYGHWQTLIMPMRQDEEQPKEDDQRDAGPEQAEPAPTEQRDAAPKEGTPEARWASDKAKKDLVKKAIKMISDEGKASIAMLQRAFKLSYTDASRLMDELEAEGIVAPAKKNERGIAETGTREILITLKK